MMRITLAGALALLMAGGCVSDVAPTAYAHNPAMSDHHKPHVMHADSDADFATTLTRLQTAIEERGFRIFAVIDHAAGAASVGQPLRPTTLVVFGNPNGGTPVMQAEQMVGLELPLKILVAEAVDGDVGLTWGDMKHTFHEYGIPDHPAADKMAGVLSSIAKDAGAAAKE